MADRYLKTVLTVIAAALVGIFIENLSGPASAQSEACGNILHPCFVTAAIPLEVTVKS